MNKLEIKKGWLTDLICTVLIKLIKKNFDILMSLSIDSLVVEQKESEVFFDVHIKGWLKQEDLVKLVQKYIRG